MSDWHEQVARGRQGLEWLFWVLAAAAVVLMFSAAMALSAWLKDQVMGQEEAAPDAIMIDLTAMPVMENIAEEPAEPVEASVAQEEVEAPEEPVEEPIEQPEPPPEPEPSPVPEPEPEPDPEPLPEPEPEPVPQPDPDPIPEPEPEPVVEPEPEPITSVRPPPRPERKPEEPRRERPREERPRKERPREERPREQPRQQRQEASQAAQGGAAASARGSATADAAARWKRQVQGQLDSHMRRKRFSGGGLKASLAIGVDGGGRITSAAIQRSTGNPTVDGQLVQHVRQRGSVAPPPDGTATTLVLPISLR